MFEAEEKGLNLIRELSGMKVPEVILVGTADNTSYLILEFLEQDVPCWKDGGFILANMHSMMRGKMFGLDHNNYIGSLPQSNTQHATWQDFYSQERIFPQIKLAIDSGKLTARELQGAEIFCSRIGEIFPEEKPSLLHGDLWSGNFMFSVEGPAVVDPAVYFGHREMDLAMTRLFGGFDAEFYEGYNEFHTLEKNWEKRVDYCNLYPLLVHVNLFGGGYADDVRRILRHFT